MEPLETGVDYEKLAQASRGRRALKRDTRFNILLIFPALGLLWLLYLAGAALFQWDASGIASPVLGFMIVVFVAFIIVLFWAFAPGAKKQ
jgi:sterol desaturase/sphingolipid hydroxylase (fatty acid hydroxylase superfamily)